MLDADAIERAAHRLADAWVTRQPLDGHVVLGADAPTTADEAYAVQQRMRELAGITTGGWKVGATSDVAQRLLGVEAPFLGVVHTERIVGGGHRFEIADWFAGSPAIEVEVGVRPTVDLDTLPVDPMALADRVDIVPCIEVVDSRFGAIIGPPGPCLIADDGVASALVVGDALDLAEEAIRGLGNMPMRLVVSDPAGDRDPVEGTASMALGHPLITLHTAASIAIGLG
ncbi:MAG: hypothetical protein AAFP84_04585, partial [Actinomycetota bacterium]